MNVYDTSRKKHNQELIDTIFQHKDLRIERIVSSGERSDWYDQVQDEWILLLSGQATLEIEEDKHKHITDLARGDYLFIPAHQRHRVMQTSTTPPCIWLCVFIEPSEQNEMREK